MMPSSGIFRHFLKMSQNPQYPRSQYELEEEPQPCQMSYPEFCPPSPQSLWHPRDPILKEVKLNEKMDEHLAHLYTLTVPDRYWLEMLSLRQDQEPPEPRDLWEAALHLQVSIPSIPVSLDHPESIFHLSFSFVESWSYYIIQVSLDCLLPRLPKCWGYRSVPPQSLRQLFNHSGVLSQT